MKKTFFITATALLLALALQAQELKCNVTVNSSKIQGTNRQIFETLQKSLNELMNNHKFTDMTFSQNEKIECTFGIIVNHYQDNLFSCEMQIQARRPVWGSSYSTTLLNLRDPAVNFTYFEYDPIIINSNSYDNNLAAIMAYYACIIIGYDLDSFQKLGGNASFAIAEQIVNMSQNRSGSEGDGWRAFDKNGKRYELINNLVDERFKRFREYCYNYHRLGLDNMTSNTANARAKIAEGLPVLKEINRLQPQAQAIVSFIDAKSDEYINIFAKHGTEKEKETVAQILSDINPSATNQYNQIKQ
ncbi:MAG: DUF4835 family protein [Tannerella sp.]|jgi:hypothetical protein|nr:DUF4835 family protein [Tannerella sp.]